MRPLEVYATILYYLHNRESVQRCLDAYAAYCRVARVEQDRNPPPSVERLRRIRAALDALRKLDAGCRDDPVPAYV